MADRRRERGQQTDHASTTALSSSARRSPQLRVVKEPLAPMLFEPRAGLPAGGRDACKHGERPCPYVRCKWHLWLVLGEDRQGSRGRHGKKWAPTTTLEPRWLEYPTPACCALDIRDAVAASGELGSFYRIGEQTNKDHTTLRRVVKLALEKLKARGIELEELLLEGTGPLEQQVGSLS